MSDNRGGAPRAPAAPARPGAPAKPPPPVPNAGRSPKPPAAGPTPAFRPRAPSAPQIAPPTPKKPVAIEALDSEFDLVDSGGWDTADTVSLKDEPKAAPPAPLTERATPLPLTPTSPGHQSVTAQMAAPAAAAPAPAPAPTPTPTPTPRQPVVKKDESVGSLVRAAVEEAVTPHIQKSHDLEAQNRELQMKLAQMQNEVTQAKQEVEIIRKASQVPVQVSVAPVQTVQQGSGSVAPPMRPSMHSTSFGPVITLPPGAPRPGELDLSNVGPIELPDFGQRKRIVGRIIVVLMLGLVLAAFIAMIVSRS